MIFKRTLLHTGDNTGARVLMCIGILGKSKKFYVGVQSSHILVSVKTFIPNKKVKKGLVFHGSLIQTRHTSKMRRFGHFVCWSSNRVVLLKKNDSVPFGTRVTHFVSFSLRKENLTRLISLSIGVL